MCEGSQAGREDQVTCRSQSRASHKDPENGEIGR